MNLAEIQKERNDLENQLAKKFQEFSEKTGCPIKGVEINRMDLTRHDGEALRNTYGYAPPRIDLEIP